LEELLKARIEEEIGYSEIINDESQLFPYGRKVLSDPISRLRILHIMRIIAERLNRKQCLIIDVGCSDGYLLFSLPRKNKKIGVDYVLKVINSAIHARNHLKRLDVEFLVNEAGSLCFRSRQAHLLVYAEILEHVPIIHPVLREAHRVLRTGGILLITVPYNDIFSMARFRTRREKLTFGSPRHKREYSFATLFGASSLSSLLRELRHVGFSCENITFIGLLPKVICSLILKSQLLTDILIILETKLSKSIPPIFGKFLLISATKPR
jgi:2-polyprenyl-3-methyl-5-hydroxy-6-metoxy-1,4-benzoquinol methylase